ncbi:outer membrane beta-barrel protein [Pedobacter miscanthi]|uniref:outer membrane beta-barrel protein n=1 Tax=Pedobacter miscanthi TaxID=2259170 RepID=UPI0013145B56|nr:outer membrane beta-barrel protein [Pedobacter miscanthi]
MTVTAFAQEGEIHGVVQSLQEKENLQFSNVVLIRKTDSIIVRNTRVDHMGHFTLNAIKNGGYSLIISYPKMADYLKDVIIKDGSKIELGVVKMDLKANLLEEVHILAAKQAISRKGDTIVYQADSFKVAEHANVKELLRRLPGIEVDINGKITAQGKDVRRILVDGDEFFGDDPVMVMEYLKAKGVSEVQVYDKKSKESDLTGIDDGKREKIINVKLKENAKNGYIGDVDLKSSFFKYNDDAALGAIYLRKYKAAVFGQKSNLNIGSFSASSFQGFTGYDDYYRINAGDEGIPGAGNNMFGSSPGSGLPDNLSLSGYFSGKWKNQSEASLNSNYFDNSSKNLQSSLTEVLLPGGSVFKSSNYNSNESRNSGTDIKTKFFLNLDSLSSLKIDIRAKQNRNENQAEIHNESFRQGDHLSSKNFQKSFETGNADIFSGNINYSKKFRRKGRSITIDLQPESKNGNGTQSNLNNTSYYDEDGNFLENLDFNLRKEEKGTETSLAARAVFTEPLFAGLSLQTAYSFKALNARSIKETFNNDGAEKVAKRIDSLSNDFRYNSSNHIERTVLQFRSGKVTASTGIEVTLTGFGLKDLDTHKNFDRNYINFSPNTYFNFRTENGTDLAIQYDGKTVQPTIAQLQPIRELDNPLYEFVGNPGLKPAFQNDFSISFRKSSVQRSSFYLNMYYSFVKDAITVNQTVDQFNKRTTGYLNLNGNSRLGISAGYDFKIKNTAILGNAGLNYGLSNRVSVLNTVNNKVTNNNYSLRGNLKYSVKDIYLSISSFLNTSIGVSSIGSVNSSRTFTHNHQLAANLKLPLKIEFNATAALNFQPSDAAFNNSVNTYQLNGYLSKKLMRGELLEIKFSANDILNQQTGYTRSVSGYSTSELTYSYIPRFFLLAVRFKLAGNFITDKKNN